jgi:hypothetical protein
MGGNNVRGGEMSKGHAWILTCLLAWTALLAGLVVLAGEPPTGPDWVRVLVSRNWQDRQRVGPLVLGQRKETTASLVGIVLSPIAAGEDFLDRGTPRNLAIELIGDLRLAEAVAVLCEWLTPKDGQVAFEGSRETNLSPAGTSLVKIGMPAVPAVLDMLATLGISSDDKGRYIHEVTGGAGHTRRVGPPIERSSPLGDQCLRILVEIKGLEETEARLRRDIAAETGEARKKNLEDALAALSRPSLREGFQHVQKQNEVREWSEWRGWWKRQEEEKARQKATEPQTPIQPALPAK